jgi:hypothetical protein
MAKGTNIVAVGSNSEVRYLMQDANNCSHTQSSVPKIKAFLTFAFATSLYTASDWAVETLTMGLAVK